MYEIVKEQLNERQLLHKLDQYPGLIPVGLDLVERQLIWRDLDRYHPYEGFFRNTIKSVDSLQPLVSKRPQIDYFTTDIDVLHNAAIVRDSIYPSGFIFHMARCGSTLLAKSLARSRTNLVLSEAAPHNLIWPYLGDHDLATIEPNATNMQLFTNLVLAMGRRRVAEHQHHFIKFTSVDLLLIEFIMTAFPTVPAIFLYRDPAEVLVSLLTRGRAGWAAQQDSAWGRLIATKANTTHDNETLTFLGAALRSFLSCALEANVSRLHYLHYRQLTPENLPRILAAFNLNYPDKEVEKMKTQFSHYSKADYRATPFEPDSEKKQKAVTVELSAQSSQQLDPLYAQLVRSPRNLIPLLNLCGNECSVNPNDNLS